MNGQHDFALIRRKLKIYGDLPFHVRIRLPIQDKSYTTALLRQHVSKFLSLDIHVPKHEDAEEIVSSIGNLRHLLSVSPAYSPESPIGPAS